MNHRAHVGAHALHLPVFHLPAWGVSLRAARLESRLRARISIGTGIDPGRLERQVRSAEAGRRALLERSNHTSIGVAGSGRAYSAPSYSSGGFGMR